ncbi:MAG: hypothetical protein M3Z84_07695 [Actinomycetota bacterium]|nr:hypothetical protein [Actinomycetota bacterium]
MPSNAQPPDQQQSDGWALGLSALLTGAGVVHLATPGVYEGIIPQPLPGSPMAWVLASGVAELACAALVANRLTRRAGATLTAILFVVLFPANIQMAVDWRSRPGVDPLLAFARLPLQVPLVLWALHVRRRAGLSHRRAPSDS